MTTRWLRPDLPVVAVLSPDTPAGALGSLYETLQIPMLAPEALAAWLDARLRGEDARLATPDAVW